MKYVSFRLICVFVSLSFGVFAATDDWQLLDISADSSCASGTLVFNQDEGPVENFVENKDLTGINFAICVHDTVKCYSSVPVSAGCSTCCILMPFGVLHTVANVSSAYACPLYAFAFPLTCLAGMCGVWRCEMLLNAQCKRSGRENESF